MLSLLRMALLLIVALLQQHATAVDSSDPTSDQGRALYEVALSGTVFLEKDQKVGWRLPGHLDPLQALQATTADFQELEKEEDRAGMVQQAQQVAQQVQQGPSDAEKAGGEQDPRDNVDMIPKWLACLNSHNKQVSFCTGCCVYRNTAAQPGNGVRGQCGFKSGIDSHPCFIPAAESTGNSDNLCFAHVSFFEADQACRHVCHFGRCGPGAAYNYNFATRNDGSNMNVASDHPPMLELDASSSTQV